MRDREDFKRGQIVIIRTDSYDPKYVGVIIKAVGFGIYVRWYAIRGQYWMPEDYTHEPSALEIIGDMPDDVEWDIPYA